MIQFAVGYQLADPDEPSFVEIVREHREHIAEVYFPWPGHPSGRSAIAVSGDGLDAAACERFEADLRALRAMGVKLDLLFNANCYGGDGMSRDLEREVVRVLDDLTRVAGGADIATTTSPAIAHILKAHAPHVERRASVNMRIGTVEGMQYLSHLFDSYHVQRDFNRNLEHLRDLKTWADANGKKLIMLANSGCLRHCSGQTFHDNLVAHESEVCRADNLNDFMPYTCWNHLRDRANWPVVLQATWVRPEDLHHYDGLFQVVKLATRLHERPHIVIRAYAERRYRGNLLDLFEPGFSPAFAPHVIDNDRFPADWFARTRTCDRRCHHCAYCAGALEHALVKLL
jgi:collagenase-like PrtC family protease